MIVLVRCRVGSPSRRWSRHRPLDRQHAQQLGNGDDLVGFFPDLDLTENEPLARGESRHDVDRALGVFFLLEVFEPDRRRVLPSTAITSAETPVCAATQANKATPEWLGVERGQDVAQVVVRRRSVLEGSGSV